MYRPLYCKNDIVNRNTTPKVKVFFFFFFLAHFSINMQNSNVERGCRCKRALSQCVCRSFKQGGAFAQAAGLIVKLESSNTFSDNI